MRMPIPFSLRRAAIAWPLLCLIVPGCAPPPPGAGSAAPPPVATQVPVLYERVGATHPAPPEWVYATPKEDDLFLYEVGLSDYHPSERDAREDAYRHAVKQFAAYTGVDVSVLERAVSVVSGRSGGVLDTARAGEDEFTHAVNAFVSRIKAENWYGEEFRVVRNGTFRGTVHKCWVKVAVPVDEYQRVQDRRRQDEDAERALREREETLARAELDAFFDAFREQLARVDAALDRGSVGEALESVRRGWGQLEDAAPRMGEGSVANEAARRTEAARQELLALVGEIRGALRFDLGRFGAFCAAPGEETPASLWLYLQRGEEVRPVIGLGLKLLDDAGGVVSRAVTDGEGRADFYLPADLASRLRVAFDLAPLAAAPEDPLLAALVLVEKCVPVAALGDDLEGAVAAAVTRLFAGPSAAPLPADRLLLGPVTYADAGRGSAFADALKRQLRSELTRIEGLQVVDPKPRSASAFDQVARARGIGLADGRRQGSIGSAAVQAAIDRADAVLETTYSLLGDDVRLDLALRAPATDALLGAATARMRQDELPQDLELLPPEEPEVPECEVPQSRDLRLEITSHLGDGQTYGAGERISFFVRTDRDAFLLLVYEDVARNLIQILPNAYSEARPFRGGEFVEVPAAADPFEFIVEPPFGVERVWAFASSRPFPRLPGEALENGLTVLSGGLDAVVSVLRGLAAEPGIAYAEARATVTTVPRKELIARH